MKINDLGADSYMYEMDDLDQQLHTLSGGGGGQQTLQCNMDWNAFSTVKALADATHSTHFASSPSDVITQAAGQSSGSLPFELDLDESTSVDCVDDPDGRLAALKLNCPTVMRFGCSFDLSLSRGSNGVPANGVPVGMYVEQVCPESCDKCPGTDSGRTPAQCVSDEFSMVQQEVTMLDHSLTNLRQESRILRQRRVWLAHPSSSRTARSCRARCATVLSTLMRPRTSSR